jgi:hypothetical protein
MEISFIDEGPFLRVRVSGLGSTREIGAQSEQILAECLARKKDLLLIDFMNVENQSIGLLDRWKLGRSILTYAGKLSKVAACAPARLMDRERFAELVARNCGVNVRAFSSLDDARHWLLAGLPSSEPKPI